jgi:hypothetical protein
LPLNQALAQKITPGEICEKNYNSHPCRYGTDQKYKPEKYMKKIIASVCALTFLMLAIFSSTVLAQEPSVTEVVTTGPTAEELAKLKQNPVSGLRQLIYVATVSPDVPDSDDSLGVHSLQLVWPFALNDDWRVVTYSILPLLDLPGVAGQDSTTGLGDTQLNFFVSPRTLGNFVWGAGTNVLLPTHSEPELGSDRVGLGPACILFYAKDAWSAGAVLQNTWSMGGSGVDKVNLFGAQYLFNYNLNDGWFLYSNAVITADWEAASDNRWTVPIGGGVGKIFNIWEQPVMASFQLLSYVEKPEYSPDWACDFQFALLFP